MGEYSLCEDYDYYGSRRDGAFAQYISKAMTKRSNIDYRFQRADDGEMSAE